MSEQANDATGWAFNPVRYLTGTPSARLLIHGILVQCAGVILSHAASAFTSEHSPDLPPMQQMLSLGWGLSMVSSFVAYIGWGVVVFACGKVVAEAIERGRTHGAG